MSVLTAVNSGKIYGSLAHTWGDKFASYRDPTNTKSIGKLTTHKMIKKYIKNTTNTCKVKFIKVFVFRMRFDIVIKEIKKRN